MWFEGESRLLMSQGYEVANSWGEGQVRDGLADFKVHHCDPRWIAKQFSTHFSGMDAQMIAGSTAFPFPIAWLGQKMFTHKNHQKKNSMFEGFISFLFNYSLVNVHEQLSGEDIDDPPAETLCVADVLIRESIWPPFLVWVVERGKGKQ